MKKTVLITGTSSGIGKTTVQYFAAKGWNVAATMRSPQKETELNTLPNVHLYALDVIDASSIKKAINEAIADFGAIDVVVNNGVAFCPLAITAQLVYGDCAYGSRKRAEMIFLINFQKGLYQNAALYPTQNSNKSLTSPVFSAIRRSWC